MGRGAPARRAARWSRVPHCTRSARARRETITPRRSTAVATARRTRATAAVRSRGGRACRMLRAWWRFLDSNQGHTGYEPAALPPELNRQAMCWGKKLRRSDSNRRPSGYEPDELPLLHAALRGYRTWHCLPRRGQRSVRRRRGGRSARRAVAGSGAGRCARLRSRVTAWGSAWQRFEGRNGH